jgi:YidC/Oxa1 family membrane protein insertase
MFHTLFYDPLYNALIFIINHIPSGDVGLATIIITCLVKLILFPLSKQATITQLKMKALEPEMAKIKEQHGANKEEFARRTLDFYKKNKLNPFASFFTMLIQLPIIFALYFIFVRGGLPVVQTDLLYSFIPTPAVIDMFFLGFIDVSKSHVVLSALAGIFQFIQIRLALPPSPPKNTDPTKKASFSDDLARSMNIQMRYIMPVIIFIASFAVSGAVALYWITGSLFIIGQELYFRKTIKKEIQK